MMKKILVWDWPVRIGHWLLVVGFSLAWLTSESEALRLLHALAGATVVAVISFRIVWGLIGSRTARFTDFVRGPAAVFDYLLGLLRLQPKHFTGHNPAGGWAILFLLGSGLLVGGTGWGLYNDLGGHWLEELHEGLAVAMLMIVMIHVAGVIASSLLHGENLSRAMISGYKSGCESESIPSARPLVLILLVIWTAAGAYWLTRC